MTWVVKLLDRNSSITRITTSREHTRP